MRSRIIVFIFVSSSAVRQVCLAQFQTWQPWLTEIGVSPFADIYYAVSTSDTIGSYFDSTSSSYKPYKIDRTGVDFVGGIQANIPPFYLRYGFSNLIGVLTGNNDTTSSPFFAHWRTGLQFPYKNTIYDLSVLFVMNIIGDAKFTGVVVEGAYFRNIAGIDVFGTARGGLENLKVPKGVKRERSEKTIGGSLGAEWHKEFITPYIGASITYPITEDKVELRWLVSVGIQLALPYTYVAGLPSIAYPRTFRGDFLEEK